MRIRATSFRACMVCVGALLAMGCGHDATDPSARSLYWQLQLNHHAVTLATVAPYDTIHLTATPLDETGTPIPTSARPTYTVSDTSVTIDSTGFVRVHWTGSDAPTVTVVATLTVGGTQGSTRVDTVMINVMNWSSAAAVPTLDSLLLQPVAGDSARRATIDETSAAGMQIFDAGVAKTMAGAPIPNVLVRYRSSDTLIASFPSPTSTTAPQVNANAPGVVLLTAEATVYGKRKVDSLWYTVGYPLRIVCSYGVGEWRKLPSIPLPENYLTLGQLQIGQGGAVLWGNSTYGKADDSLDVEFDRTTGVAGVTTTTEFSGGINGVITIPPDSGGNIPSFPAAVPQHNSDFGLTVVSFDSLTSKARFFTRPGLYQWSSRHQGISGTVTVVSNDSLHPR